MSKSRLSNKTKLLMKKMKVSTTINNTLSNVGVSVDSSDPPELENVE
jgi:hypothetical protein